MIAWLLARSGLPADAIHPQPVAVPRMGGGLVTALREPIDERAGRSSGAVTAPVGGRR